MDTEITFRYVGNLFREKIAQLQREPEFRWDKENMRYATSQDGEPLIKLVVGNVPLDYDLWKGLRNPALVGLYPAGIREIWEYYANRTRRSTDELGRQTIFQVPQSFDLARASYKRAVVISVMLPFSEGVIEEYTEHILERGKGSSHLFARMYEDVNLMIDKAISRVAIDLVTNDTAVVALNNDTVGALSRTTVPLAHQEASHGPCKGGNYSQSSVAALLGLGQFGVSRIIFRDEFIKGEIRRFTGPIRSIVVFDKQNLIKDGAGGVVFPNETWRTFLLRLFDFCDTDPEINKYRFCSYIPHNDEGCRRCVRHCPSGAQVNSVPSHTGEYREDTSKQTHRFWEGRLQFDFARCSETRQQMTSLFPEWSCARCLSLCVVGGRRRIYAAKNFNTKMLELTSGAET